MLAGTLYDSSYSISVAVTIGKSLKAYGPACTLITPHPYTKIKDSQCGTTLAALNTAIYTPNAIPGATGYRFEVTNGGNIYTYDSLINAFNLSMLNVPILYGTTYSIRVAVNYYNVLQPYGESCTISTPLSPAKIVDFQCGYTLQALNTTIYSITVLGSTSYRFEVTNGNNVYYYDSMTKSFNLTMLNIPILYGETYSIKVSVYNCNAWQPYGNSCLVTTPIVPLSKIRDSQCGITLNSNNSTLLYANPVSLAQMYRFEVSLGSNVYIYDTPSSSVRSFSLVNVSGLTLASGTIYTIRVAIKANDYWQPFGASCTVSTSGNPNSKNIETETISESTFSIAANPNPFTNNFNLSLKTSSENKLDIMVYDMTGRLYDKREVNSSEILELQFGDNYPTGVYNVIVNQGDTIKTLRLIKR
jgi:hypothetical protein